MTNKQTWKVHVIYQRPPFQFLHSAFSSPPHRTHALYYIDCIACDGRNSNSCSWIHISHMNDQHKKNENEVERTRLQISVLHSLKRAQRRTINWNWAKRNHKIGINQRPTISWIRHFRISLLRITAYPIAVHHFHGWFRTLRARHLYKFSTLFSRTTPDHAVVKTTYGTVSIREWNWWIFFLKIFAKLFSLSFYWFSILLFRTPKKPKRKRRGEKNFILLFVLNCQIAHITHKRSQYSLSLSSHILVRCTGHWGLSQLFVVV